MLEPDDLAGQVMQGADSAAVADGPLFGKRVTVTAGPTREVLDPVRYITNRSSGKMGYAIARAARDAGAKVILISGPVNLTKPAGVTVVDILSAQELHAAAQEHAANTDVFIAAAAVADYRPATVQREKMKKSSEEVTIQLVRTPDTLASVSALAERPFCVGFAAETNDVKQYALKKLANKKLDMIVANKVGDKLAFDSDDNELQVLWQGGERLLPTAAKTLLAQQLIELIGERFAATIPGITNVTPISAGDQ